MTTFFLLRTAVIWFKCFLNRILLEFFINTCLCSSSMFLILPSYCFNWWRACNWNLICFVMKIFGPISQRFCLFEIPPQFSLSVWFFLLSIVKVWHLQMMMIIIFSNYDLMEKAKTSRDAAGSPLAAESCSSNWIEIGRQIGFESFGCFCVDDDMSCLSQAMLVRVNHFTHLTILQICLNTLLLSLSLSLTFKKQSINVFQLLLCFFPV